MTLAEDLGGTRHVAELLVRLVDRDVRRVARREAAVGGDELNVIN